MPSNKHAWELACALARSGEYANVVMIERELRRRGILEAGACVTTHILKRELLTRLCHAARNGGDHASPVSDFLSRATRTLSFSPQSEDVASTGSAPAR